MNNLQQTIRSGSIVATICGVSTVDEIATSINKFCAKLRETHRLTKHAPSSMALLYNDAVDYDGRIDFINDRIRGCCKTSGLLLKDEDAAVMDELACFVYGNCRRSCEQRYPHNGYFEYADRRNEFDKAINHADMQLEYVRRLFESVYTAYENSF